MVVELVAEKPVLCGMKCVLSMLLRNYTSVSSSSTFCCRPFAEFRWCCFRGSKASTIICSVPFISARQKGHPYKQNKLLSENDLFLFEYEAKCLKYVENIALLMNIWNLSIKICIVRMLPLYIPVLQSRPAMTLDTVYRVNDRRVRF